MVVGKAAPAEQVTGVTATGKGDHLVSSLHWKDQRWVEKCGRTASIFDFLIPMSTVGPGTGSPAHCGWVTVLQIRPSGDNASAAALLSKSLEEQARTKGGLSPQFAVFPEEFVDGSPLLRLTLPADSPGCLGSPADRRWWAPFADSARSSRCCLVLGSVAEQVQSASTATATGASTTVSESEGASASGSGSCGGEHNDGTALCYNTSVVLGDDGEPVMRYRKRHLVAGEEMMTRTPGNSLGLAWAKGRPISVMICHDLDNPELRNECFTAVANLPPPGSMEEPRGRPLVFNPNAVGPASMQAQTLQMIENGSWVTSLDALRLRLEREVRASGVSIVRVGTPFVPPPYESESPTVGIGSSIMITPNGTYFPPTCKQAVFDFPLDASADLSAIYSSFPLPPRSRELDESGLRFTVKYTRWTPQQRAILESVGTPQSPLLHITDKHIALILSPDPSHNCIWDTPTLIASKAPPPPQTLPTPDPSALPPNCTCPCGCTTIPQLTNDNWRVCADPMWWEFGQPLRAAATNSRELVVLLGNCDVAVVTFTANNTPLKISDLLKLGVSKNT
ncbi:hypothetical protein Pelo_11762 [Pelomyxa schiedti]|nr:hypothetical protein Pelo_11762 [Pelomyxa schiedti]